MAIYLGTNNIVDETLLYRSQTLNLQHNSQQFGDKKKSVYVCGAGTSADCSGMNFAGTMSFSRRSTTPPVDTPSGTHDHYYRIGFARWILRRRQTGCVCVCCTRLPPPWLTGRPLHRRNRHHFPPTTYLLIHPHTQTYKIYTRIFISYRKYRCFVFFFFSFQQL